MTAVRLLAGTQAGRPLSLSEHLEVHGAPGPAGPGLIEAVARAGLRGRGGAGFPTATKLRTVVASGRRTPVVVVNAAEGEPMSAKDGRLLALAPHLVLDGAAAAAATVNARSVVLAVRENAGAGLAALQSALAERSDRQRFELRSVPVAYLAGEESALLRHLGGGPLLPTLVPPLPAHRGLRGRPTLVQNPETLAHLALIARHGDEWFRAVGTEADPGTSLVTVSGAVRRPAVMEIANGTRLQDVLAHAGGSTEPIRAVLVGGYYGQWLPAPVMASVTLDAVGLGPHRAALAAGVLVALGQSACPVREIAGVMAWLASQSAGQCGPCTHGLPALAELVGLVADGRAPRDHAIRLERWGTQVAGRGACRLPDGAVAFLRSGLRVFADDFATHAKRGRCSSSRRPLTLSTPSAQRWAA